MVYTDGYMAHDPGYVRFYAYLSLFSSSMLGLVVSPNLVQVYFLNWSACVRTCWWSGLVRPQEQQMLLKRHL